MFCKDFEISYLSLYYMIINKLSRSKPIDNLIITDFTNKLWIKKID